MILFVILPHFLFLLSYGINLSYIMSDDTLVSYQSDSLIEIIDRITTKSYMTFTLTSFGENPIEIKNKKIEFEGIEIFFKFLKTINN